VEPHPNRMTGAEPTVIFVGEVGLRKGVDLLCAAWQKLAMEEHPWRLFIVGPTSQLDDHVRAKLTQLVGAKLWGELPHPTVQEMLLSADVLIQPSRAEAFPMAVCEAL